MGKHHLDLLEVVVGVFPFLDLRGAGEVVISWELLPQRKNGPASKCAGKEKFLGCRYHSLGFREGRGGIGLSANPGLSMGLCSSAT